MSLFLPHLRVILRKPLNKKGGTMFKGTRFWVWIGLSFANVALATNAPTTCYIQTFNGHYLTAAGGGGQLDNAIHADAVTPKAWEKFTLVDAGLGTPNVTYGIRTSGGYYVTAVNGGGQATNVLHTDGGWIKDWEEFQLVSLGGGWYAIRTYNGYYLTAVNGGGQTTNAIHSDSKQIRTWERFKLTCGVH